MADLDNLLDSVIAENELENGHIVLSIDEPSRTITHDGKIILGVEFDDRAERIHFIAPPVVGDNLDLTSENTYVWIKFVNAFNETNFIECTDKVAVVEGDTTKYVKFSWLLTDTVTEKKGSVKFSVWFKYIDGDGNVKQEWHTTYTEGTILEGIEITNQTPEIVADEKSMISVLTDRVDACEARVAAIDAYSKEEILVMINEAKDELNTEIDKDVDNAKTELHAEIDKDVAAAKTALQAEIDSDVNAAKEDLNAVIDADIAYAMDNLKQEILNDATRYIIKVANVSALESLTSEPEGAIAIVEE